MSDCIFCKIINKEIPSEIVYEDSEILAFKDINPVAPVHIVFVPKKHICCLNKIENDDIELIGKIFMAIKKVAEDLGISEGGYRVINNCGENAGQTVKHIHFHLIGGTNLGEKLI